MKRYINFNNINYINQEKDDIGLNYEVYMGNNSMLIIRDLENTFIIFGGKAWYTYNFKDFIKYINE